MFIVLADAASRCVPLSIRIVRALIDRLPTAMEALDDLQSKSGVSAEDRSSASLSAAYGSSSKRPPPPPAAAVDVRPSAQPSNAQPYFQRHQAAARAATVAAAPWHAITSAIAHVRRMPPPVGPAIGAQISGTYDPSPASSYVSDSRRRNASRPFVPQAARKYRRPHCCAQPVTLWTLYILFCAGVVGAGILIGDLHAKQVVLVAPKPSGGQGGVSVQVKDGGTTTISTTVTADAGAAAATSTSGGAGAQVTQDSSLHKVFYGSAFALTEPRSSSQSATSRAICVRRIHIVSADRTVPYPCRDLQKEVDSDVQILAQRA